MPQALPAIGAFFVAKGTIATVLWAIARTVIVNFALGSMEDADENEPEPRKRRVFPLLVRHFRKTLSPTARAFEIRGNCLRPYFLSGDVVWVDQRAPMHTGQVVLCAMKYRTENGQIKTRRALKQLRFDAGELLLCCADGSVFADAHEILAPVVAWYRPGCWKRARVRCMLYPTEPSELADYSMPPSPRGLIETRVLPVRAFQPMFLIGNQQRPHCKATDGAQVG